MKLCTQAKLKFKLNQALEKEATLKVPNKVIEPTIHISSRCLYSSSKKT